MKMGIKIAILLSLVILVSACSSNSHSSNDNSFAEDKEYILRGLNDLTENSNMIINEIIYIHKIDISDGLYIYDATFHEHIKPDAAYEIKMNIAENGNNYYIYDYFYIDDNDESLKKYDGIINNHETLLKSDKYYFVDENDNRLDYIDIDRKWIEENIMIYY